MKSTYLIPEEDGGHDPASGGAYRLDFPFWNPRDYWLVVLASRIDQATMEWRNLLQNYDQRLEHYGRNIIEIIMFDLLIPHRKSPVLTMPS